MKQGQEARKRFLTEESKITDQEPQLRERPAIKQSVR